MVTAPEHTHTHTLAGSPHTSHGTKTNLLLNTFTSAQQKWWRSIWCCNIRLICHWRGDHKDLIASTHLPARTSQADPKPPCKSLTGLEPAVSTLVHGPVFTSAATLRYTARLNSYRWSSVLKRQYVSPESKHAAGAIKRGGPSSLSLAGPESLHSAPFYVSSPALNKLPVALWRRINHAPRAEQLTGYDPPTLICRLTKLPTTPPQPFHCIPLY